MNLNHTSIGRGERAHTLVELVVSVALLAVMFVALFGGMSGGFAVTQVARENLRATQILLERMEGIRLFNWEQLCYSNWIPSQFTNYYYPLAMTNSGESLGIKYVGTMTIVANPTLTPSASYSTNMVAVVANINWTSCGVPRSRTMSTYVGRNGVQNYVYNSTNYIQ
jgi:type II secretory pathway pseudopilin PulG